jgi:hypothetical protein
MDRDGRFIPLLDETFETALAYWEEEKRIFDTIGAAIDVENPDPKDLKEGEKIVEFEGKTYKVFPDEKDFIEWHGDKPNPDWYRPKFDSEATHYQIYENVTEGTPVSPVFENKEDMRNWLIEKGYDEKAATKFVEMEWAPSFVLTEKGVSGLGIDALEDI